MTRRRGATDLPQSYSLVESRAAGKGSGEAEASIQAHFRGDAGPSGFESTFLASRILFGNGTLGRIRTEAERLGKRRALLVCTPSLVGSAHAARLRAGLEEVLVAEFSGVAPHVPLESVEAGMLVAREHQVDLIVALGGGSAIGLGKAISYRHGGEAYLPATFLSQPRVPLIAIPVTYAGSEVTPVMGVTHRAQKRTTSDPRLMPKLTIYDPEVTLDLPARLTASTGINALAHCIEAVYSPSAGPFVSPVALHAISIIRTALPRCTKEGRNVRARTEMLLGSFLAAFSLAHASMAVHHALCHSLGGRFKIPHGIANAVILPHAMRFNADAVALPLAQAGVALGVPAKGDSHRVALGGADAIFDLVSSLGLPQRLRDLALGEADLSAVAQDAMASPGVRANPKPITSPRQLLEILRAAW